MVTTASDYNKLAKNNWTPEEEKSFASILIGANELHMLLSHFAVVWCNILKPMSSVAIS
jgi:hypothetical protein